MTARKHTMNLTDADFAAAGNIRRAAAEAAPAKRVVVRMFDRILVAHINDHASEIGLSRTLDESNRDALYSLTPAENALIITYFKR